MKITNINELKTYLIEKKYEEDAISEFIKIIKPIYDFYDFMLITHNMNYDAVEKDSSEFSMKVLPEYLSQLSENTMKIMLESSGEIMKRYANKYDHTESENVKLAMNKYIELTFKSNFKNE